MNEEDRKRKERTRKIWEQRRARWAKWKEEQAKNGK
jgi:hypothetical protein